MNYPAKQLLLLSVLVTGVLGCAAQTRYSGMPVASMSDEQLSDELTSALQGFGMAASRSQYLIAIRPEPAYVLTSSSTTFSGSMTATYNAYSMPVGYGVSTWGSMDGSVRGSSSTQYQYTDVRAGERLGNSIALAISRSKQAKYRRRAEEVWTAYQSRAAQRRAETERVIANFFAARPELGERRMLVAAVAPWVASEGSVEGTATLERAADVIAAMRRGRGVSGPWYGMFSQTSKLDNGETIAFSQFVKVELTQDGDRLVGKGKLGSGELVELEGKMDGPKLSAAVANTTSAINVTLAAVAATTQITGEFSGSGAGQRITGTVVLLR
jgi:hypothetical protein